MSGVALIIEQTKDRFAQIRAWIAEGGYSAIATQSGHEGLELAKREKPDLVLLDLAIKDLHGSSVCENLKLTESTNLIPLVMVTREGAQADLVGGLRVEADAYLAKPDDAEALSHAIERAIHRKHQTKEAGLCGEICFDLRSNVAHLKQAHAKIIALFERTTLSEKEVREMGQAVLEMGMNAIEWGNRSDPELLVNIEYRYNQEKVVLTVRDEGPGFDPKNLPHAAQDEDPVAHMLVRETLGLREGGFGIMLAKGMVDSVSYNETGNEVTLVKSFPAETREENT